MEFENEEVAVKNGVILNAGSGSRVLEEIDASGISGIEFMSREGDRHDKRGQLLRLYDRGAIASCMISDLPLVRDLKVDDGAAASDFSRDILKEVVVEKNKRTWRVGVGFVNGSGLKRGDHASSVAHDAGGELSILYIYDDLSLRTSRNSKAPHYRRGLHRHFCGRHQTAL